MVEVVEVVDVVEVVELVKIDCEKSMKLETSPKVTKSKRNLHWCRSISNKNTCAFFVRHSISQKVITLSGRMFITVSGFLLHYRAVITLSGVFLLHYRARITVSGVYYIIGWYRPTGEGVQPAMTLMQSPDVGTMEGKAWEVVEMMTMRKMEVLCVQETKWKGDRARKMAEGYKMLHAVGDGRSNGVGIIVNVEISKDVVRVDRWQGRIIAVWMMIRQQLVCVICVYGPQTGRTYGGREGGFQRRDGEVGRSERRSDDAVRCGRFQCAHRCG